jgi:hypothetical protein
MEYEDMSAEELQELQEKHRRQMEYNLEQVRAKKARRRRLARRGEFIENAIDGAENMTDEEFKEVFFELIRQQ